MVTRRDIERSAYDMADEARQLMRVQTILGRYNCMPAGGTIRRRHLEGPGGHLS